MNDRIESLWADEKQRHPTWAEVRAARQNERQYPFVPIKGESWFRFLRRLPWVLKNASSPLEKLKFKRERMHQGFSEYDWWSIDKHFAQMIAKVARKYRNEGHGYPTQLDDDKKPLPEVLAVAQWNTILTEMADGFDNYAQEIITTDSPQFKRAMSLFAEWFPALWD